MSNDIAVRVEGLGKKYRLGHTVDLKRTFRETLTELPLDIANAIAAPFRKKTASVFTDLPEGIPAVSTGGGLLVSEHAARKPEEDFWALKDINFEINRGEAVGIIGRNGAGKSTLLKILSRVVSPTTGRVEMHGRLASLLEVGTGFHPELTGRENIYLNGAILGMKKKEIDRKFDEIVAFAEVEQFLDTPVKRYSSGMYVRLAFAVAAHLEPEILIVDEVLAVGDATFQRKCLGRMNDVAQEGRTILFVSHQMDAVRRLCKKGIWLERGAIKETGSADQIVLSYQRTALVDDLSNDGVFVRSANTSGKPLAITKAVLRHPTRGKTTSFSFMDEMEVELEINGGRGAGQPSCYALYRIWSESGAPVSVGDTSSQHIAIDANSPMLKCRIGPLPLYAQRYWLEFGLGIQQIGRVDTWESQIFFDIVSCDPYETGNSYDARSGVVHINNAWFHTEENRYAV